MNLQHILENLEIHFPINEGHETSANHDALAAMHPHGDVGCALSAGYSGGIFDFPSNESFPLGAHKQLLRSAFEIIFGWASSNSTKLSPFIWTD